jgi:hypothetical protein
MELAVFVRAEMETDSAILEQMEWFNYLGCKPSLEEEPDFDEKINRFPWGPTSLLYNGYRVFSGGKVAGTWC